MGAPGLNELKNKFALTPSSQTSSSGSSLQVQLLPSILCTEGGPLAKFLGIVCPLMRGCLLNISLHHTWKLPTKTDSSSESSRAEQTLLPDSSWQLGENFRTSKGDIKEMNDVIPGPNGIWWGSSVCTDSWEHPRIREGYSQGATEFLFWMEFFDLILMKIHIRMTSLASVLKTLVTS